MEEKEPVKSNVSSQPFSYADLVNYQDGSIVSRTIIDKPEGTVTVFAFDKGQRLSTHSAPFDALLEVVDGAGVVTIMNEKHTIHSGFQIIMPANKPHAVMAEERFKMVLIMIKNRE